MKMRQSSPKSNCPICRARPGAQAADPAHLLFQPTRDIGDWRSVQNAAMSGGEFKLLASGWHPSKMTSFAGKVGYTGSMKQICACLCAITLAWPAFAAPPQTSLPAAVVPDGLGVNIHFTDARPGELEMLAAAGFHWVRMDFSWGGTEKRPGEYDFSAYDRLLASLETKKLRALFILDYGNSLYEADSAVATEAGRRAFSRWAAAAAVHFNGHGILWEIWNEPNIGFWKPKPNVADYAALALAAAKAIHAAAPGEAVIGPATSGVDLQFLESCFKAGLLDWWDAVSVHPYRQSAPESAEADYQKLRGLIARYAPKGKSIPIISGEWGYSSAWQNFDAAAQGQMLARQWLVNLANQIPLSIWYDWHEDGTDPQEPEHHFGTVANAYHAGGSPVYQPKPAYLAAKTLTSVLQGFQFTKRLALGNPDDYALLFHKGDRLRLAVWTTSPTPQPVRIRSSPGEFEIINHTGERGKTILANENGLAFTPTLAPQYLIVRKSNPLLRSAPAAWPLHARLGLASDKTLAVQIENQSDASFNGTLHLTQTASLNNSAKLSIKLKPGETSQLLHVVSAPSTTSEIVAGLRLESEGAVMLELTPRRFRLLPDAMLSASRIVSDGDAKVVSQQSIAVSPAPEPFSGLSSQAVKVNYQCDEGWKFFRIVPPEGKAREIAGKPVGFGIWVYGDGRNASPRLRIVDATGQTFQPTAAAIAWAGWRYVEFDFNAPAGHWGGANDDVMHFPIRWDTLFLIDNVARQKSEGTLYLASPALIYQ